MAKGSEMKTSVNGWNAEYIQNLYQQYLEDPESLEEKWHAFFQGFELAQEVLPKDESKTAPLNGTNGASIENKTKTITEYSPSVGDFEFLQSHVDSLIYHYRDIGHLQANIDPLQQRARRTSMLELSNFELAEEHLEMEFHTNHLGFGPDRMKLKDVISVLEETYCGSIGVEYMDIQSTEERRWLQSKMEESKNQQELTADEKIRIARKLRKSHAFEKFLQTNYVGQKRFSLEGAETVIAVLDTLLNKSPENGINQVVMGMAHRGRLNVLANIINKSYAEIFQEFEDNFQPGTIMGDGDVKYHKGASTDFKTADGDVVHLSLTANPSHLEAVDPVVVGRVRAKQRNCGDTDRKEVMGVLVHGDAAFAGQGIVAETLNLSQLRGYQTGGTVHVIINNQIGFTTLPEDARSGDYSTDVAKMIQAPIFHVNGDDPEACVRVTKLALEYKQKFKKDVVIDMYCYRKHGHNEGDEPSFTQPKMYEIIRQHPPVHEIYQKKLIDDKVITKSEFNKFAKELDSELETAQKLAIDTDVQPENIPFRDEWKGYKPNYHFKKVNTVISKLSIEKVCKSWVTFPDDFEVNRKIKNIMKKRKESVEEGKAIDWATGEALAIGSLLLDNVPVRLSGQDSRRGTFSHRHAVVWDLKSAEKYMPMSFISDKQARFCAYDSCLSEAAVLGFDYGYSLDNPDMLICWEAQFGDFANGAQTIIDQFIATSESKWSRVSGIVLLLPHGYEGQGPEHSSGWMERFLQLAAEENMQICNLTSSAQYFHALRQQMKRDFRKPMIIMTPKSGLRSSDYCSTIEDFTHGEFHRIIEDEIVEPSKVKKVVVCSGKVYYDLAKKREEDKRDDIALIRLEQIYPFHKVRMKEILSKYKKAKSYVWCQEETKNKGAWTFVSDAFKEDLGIELEYVGRERAASPAVGSLSMHKHEHQEILDGIFS